MARFDVFTNQDDVFLLDVRADQLERLGNLVLVPLIPTHRAPRPLRGLNPAFWIGGEHYLMMTQLVASAPRNEFSVPIANLAQHRDEIVRALDVLFIGF